MSQPFCHPPLGSSALPSRRQGPEYRLTRSKAKGVHTGPASLPESFPALCFRLSSRDEGGLVFTHLGCYCLSPLPPVPTRTYTREDRRFGFVHLVVFK